MNKNYVEVNIVGGLGNQLFQFSAGYALAKDKNAKLIINASTFDSYKVWGFELSKFCGVQKVAEITYKPFFPQSNSLMGRLIKLIHKQTDLRYFNEKSFTYDPEIQARNLPLRLNGYFQSPKYFNSHRKELLKVLKTFSGSERFMKSLHQIKSSRIPISLHVRRGDYLTSAAAKVHPVLNTDYYQKAVVIMKEKYLNCHFFVFTDDPSHVENEFRFLGERMTIISDNNAPPHEDLLLMSHCSHNIIANSTFSWWGSWLNENSDQTVICPKNWFTPDVLVQKPVSDLFPENWIQI